MRPHRKKFYHAVLDTKLRLAYPAENQLHARRMMSAMNSDLSATGFYRPVKKFYINTHEKPKPISKRHDSAGGIRPDDQTKTTVEAPAGA